MYNHLLTKKEREKLKDPLISNFLNEEENYKKFLEFIESPSFEAKVVLDSAFKEYYKKVKVISYIDKLIHFFSIDLDKKKNRYQANHRLILDKPIRENDSMTMKDSLATTQPSVLNSCGFPLEELLEDLHLYKAWNSLSLKQRKIITLKYQYNLKDVDIADILSDTKQVISYNHKKAIKILRSSVQNK